MNWYEFLAYGLTGALIHAAGYWQGRSHGARRGYLKAKRERLEEDMKFYARLPAALDGGRQ